MMKVTNVFIGEMGKLIYLDYAATTFRKPKSVYKAVYKAMRDFGANPGRGGHALALRAAGEVYKTREILAELFGADPENVAFTKNATEALNITIKGLAKKEQNIVISGIEHNSVYRPAFALAGEALKIAKVSAQSFEETVRSFETAIDKNTGLVICSAASNVCGLKMPLAEIGKICRENGALFVVDAAQGAGLLDLKLAEIGADAICVAGHKGLYGPQGSGAIICSGGLSFDTVFEGGSGTDSLSPVMPECLPERLEYGTLNVPSIAGLRAGAEFIKKHREELLQKESDLAEKAASALAEIGEVHGYKGKNENLPVIAFNFFGKGCEAAAEGFDRRGVALRAGWHCAPLAHHTLGTIGKGAIRASIGAFTTTKDISKFIDIAAKIAK